MKKGIKLYIYINYTFIVRMLVMNTGGEKNETTTQGLGSFATVAARELV